MKNVVENVYINFRVQRVTPIPVILFLLVRIKLHSFLSLAKVNSADYRTKLLLLRECAAQCSLRHFR